MWRTPYLDPPTSDEDLGPEPFEHTFSGWLRSAVELLLLAVYVVLLAFIVDYAWRQLQSVDLAGLFLRL
jgi:hypothetical protein